MQRIIVFIVLMVSISPVIGQNCDVDFPGTSVLNFTTGCGGTSAANLELGKNIYFGNGDSFTFNAPVIDISGNVKIEAEGGGKIIIPVGNTVNVAGNFDLKDKNSGCSSANPCVFEIEVNGTLTISGNLQNDLVTLVWSGSGTVIVSDDFKNSSNGCMACDAGGCPTIQTDASDCQDDGSGCSGGDFCTQITDCSSDATDPVISGCPSPQVVNISGPGCTQTVSWTAPTATDNCTLSSFTSSHNPGAAFPRGITTVTYIATDAAGNSSTCSFNVTVNDLIVPVISGCPSNQIINMSGPGCTQPVSWTPPTAADNCSIGSFTTTHSPGTAFPKGITTVTYTALDASGNSSTCSFTVTVNDLIIPVISGCPSNQVVNMTGPGCTQPVSWTAPTAIDNCSISSLTNTHNPGTAFPTGITTVIYTATDASGNSSICSFTVTVTEGIPPVFDSCSPTIVITEYNAVTESGVASWNIPLVTDCGTITLTSSANPGDTFPKGITVVTYTAQDNWGNISTCNFEVNIDGNNVPVANAVSVTTTAGQPLEICLDVTDPDGDPVVLKALNYSSPNGEINGMNGLCFTYTSLEDFEGTESFTATICDEQTPQACGSVEIQIHVLTDKQLVIYKALTPNRDGFNDVWHIKNIEEYPNNKVTIFDRWGSQVFSGEGYNNETVVWDGRGGGKAMPSGTYFYSIHLNEGGLVFKGSLELVN